MLDSKNKKTRAKELIIFTCCLCTLCFLLQGCEPLRKKFTRKKRKDRDVVKEVPVLEPVDYPEKIYNPVNTYKKHFSLWQVWHKELITDLASASATDKRLLYHLNEAIANLQECKNLLTEEKRVFLDSSIKKLEGFQKDLESPVPSASLETWKRRAESIYRKVRRDYNISKIEENIRK